MRILLAGGTGLIGQHLTKILAARGHEICLLSRKLGNSIYPSFIWDPEKKYIDERALNGCDAIINLSGISISKGRWTSAQKKAILDSRVDSTRLLYEKISKSITTIKTIVSASAIGIYGNCGDEWVNESHKPSSDFLGTTCKQWEEKTEKFSSIGIRTVIIRIGLVLAATGGILPVIKRPVRLGLGAVLGNGHQYMSWIHMEDLCTILLRTIEDTSLQGIYNATSPTPVKHKEFMLTMAKVCHRPFWLPALPAWVLKLVLGEKAELVLSGQRVSSQKIMEAGFRFRFTELEKALENLIQDKP